MITPERKKERGFCRQKECVPVPGEFGRRPKQARFERMNEGLSSNVSTHARFHAGFFAFEASFVVLRDDAAFCEYSSCRGIENS
jgi:hypothetical protein